MFSKKKNEIMVSKKSRPLLNNLISFGPCLSEIWMSAFEMFCSVNIMNDA